MGHAEGDGCVLSRERRERRGPHLRASQWVRGQRGRIRVRLIGYPLMAGFATADAAGSCGGFPVRGSGKHAGILNPAGTSSTVAGAEARHPAVPLAAFFRRHLQPRVSHRIASSSGNTAGLTLSPAHRRGGRPPRPSRSAPQTPEAAVTLAEQRAPAANTPRRDTGMSLARAAVTPQGTDLPASSNVQICF